MKPTQKLHNLGQSLWLDNITRGLLTSGTLRRYIDELSVTGLTSNPSIFDNAIKDSSLYDDAIHQKLKECKSGEALLLRACNRRSEAGRRPLPADLRPDQWHRRLGLARSFTASSPTTRQATIAEVKQLYMPAPSGPTSSSQIPGTRAGVPAIEESIFAGLPVNVTLLFSREHYVAAAGAYLRGVERRIQAGISTRTCVQWLRSSSAAGTKRR
jgi:transaldolase